MTKRTATYLTYTAIILVVIAIVVMFRKQLFPKSFNDEVDMLSDNFKAKIFNLISGFEGYFSHAYHGKADRPGVYTIGYGTIYNWDAKRTVKLGDVIDKATATRWFFIEANTKTAEVTSMVKVPINENQLLALSSLAYNIGTGANGLKGSTLLRLLNSGNAKAIVANEFDKWVYSNGKKVAGLVTRRKKEKILFLS